MQEEEETEPPISKGHIVLKENRVYGFVLRLEMLPCHLFKCTKKEKHEGHGPYCYLYCKDKHGLWCNRFFGARKTFPRVVSPKILKAKIRQLLEKQEASQLPYKECAQLQNLTNEIICTSQETEDLVMEAFRALRRWRDINAQETRTQWEHLLAKARAKGLTKKEAKQFKSLSALVSIDH